MNSTEWAANAALLFALSASITAQVVSAQTTKTYKHAPEYQVAILDQNLQLTTGRDATAAKTSTDAKLGPSGQAFHFLHTERGDFRVEAPVNKGRSFAAALAAGTANSNRPYWNQVEPPTIHNNWFLDKVQPGTQVLFAANCRKPNKKHPNDTVRCEFWFPDPDSESHEYETIGDFTPYMVDDGSNTQKAASTLCGAHKLNPETEAKICGEKGK